MTTTLPAAKATTPADRLVRPLTFGLFVGCVLAANYATNRWGLITIAGITATAGTLAAGLTFGVRDALHEAGGRRWTVAAILIGAGLSWLLAPSLAVASAVAFLLSELLDLAVYTPLRERQWGTAVVASNLAGSIADSVVFLWLAGFPIADALAGQVTLKMATTIIAIPFVWWVRARRR